MKKTQNLDIDNQSKVQEEEGGGGDLRTSKRGGPQREGEHNKRGYCRSNGKIGPRGRGRKRGRRSMRRSQ